MDTTKVAVELVKDPCNNAFYTSKCTSLSRLIVVKSFILQGLAFQHFPLH
jgi:hypothetical protein